MKLNKEHRERLISALQEAQDDLKKVEDLYSWKLDDLRRATEEQNESNTRNGVDEVLSIPDHPESWLLDRWELDRILKTHAIALIKNALINNRIEEI